MPNQADKLEEKRDELIFDLIKRRYDEEIDIANKLDDKANKMIGFVSVVVGLILGTGSVLSGAELSDGIFFANQYTTTLYYVGVAALLISIGCALVALKVRNWTVVPNVDTLIERYTKREYRDVLRTNAVEMKYSITNSEKINGNKAIFIDFSWYALLLGLMLIFVSYMIISGIKSNVL